MSNIYQQIEWESVVFVLLKIFARDLFTSTPTHPDGKSMHTIKSNEHLWYSSPISSPSIPPMSGSKNHRTSKSNESVVFIVMKIFARDLFTSRWQIQAYHYIEWASVYGILCRFLVQASHRCQVPRITGPANVTRVCGIPRHENFRQGFIHIYSPHPDFRDEEYHRLSFDLLVLWFLEPDIGGMLGLEIGEEYHKRSFDLLVCLDLSIGVGIMWLGLVSCGWGKRLWVNVNNYLQFNVNNSLEKILSDEYHRLVIGEEYHRRSFDLLVCLDLSIGVGVMWLVMVFLITNNELSNFADVHLLM